MTPRQSDCLRFIRAYQARTGGVSPSLVEIANHLGLASKSGAHRLLTSLEQLGRIRRRTNRIRDIEIVRPSSLIYTDLSQDMASLIAVYGPESVQAEFCRQTGRAA